jgi:predicted acyl esterase
VLRRLLLLVLVALAAAAPANAFSKRDVTIAMSDGAPIAATLTLPDAAAPAAGFPAVILLHGLGGDRSTAETVAQTMGLFGEDYAVLTFDARGHGASGGLIGIDGPREIADTRAVFDWLAARADVADGRIGAWGISYGGGAVWNSLAAGTPWAAIEVCETWTDLYAALAPQGLAKSGVIGAFVSSLPPARVDPEVFRVRDRAFAGGDLSAIRPFTDPRSSLGRLTGVRVPTFFMQGRRDFAFGLDQATKAYERLAGPKRLWIGNHGHAPSSFPAADSGRMLAEGKEWFDRFLRGSANGIDSRKPIVVADEGKATTRAYDSIPKQGYLLTSTFRKPKTIGPGGKIVSSWRARGSEIFGSPNVRVLATATAGYSRLVAVLSARTPAGKELVVSGGGVPLRAGTRIYKIGLIDQATAIPRGSTLRVTLASSSLAQNPGNLLYLSLPLPAKARLSVREVALHYTVRTR